MVITALFIAVFLFFLSVALLVANKQDIALSLSMEHKLKAEMAARSVAFELSTSDAVVRFVQLGFGAALVPRSASRGRDVTVRALIDPAAAHPVSLIHRPPVPAAPAAQALVALLSLDPAAHDRTVGPPS